jgi:AraC-like DNA-binding protein
MEPVWSEVNLGRHLRVDMYWARSHRWRAGQTWDRITMPAYVLWIVRRGAVEVTLDGCPFHLCAGDAWLHPQAKRRAIRVLQDADWLSLGLTATLYENVDALAPLAPAQWQPARRDRIESWIQELVDVERAHTFAGSLIGDGLVRAVVGWCWESLEGDLYQLARRELPMWLDRTLNTIHRRPTVTVGELIRESGYSPAQFRRRFFHALGCSPRDYLMRRRLETARRLLLADELAIAAIADQCGFHDAAQFTRIFKRAFEVAPLRFRQIAKRQIL